MERNHVLTAIRKLGGYQAISLDEAFRLLLNGRGDPDIMPLRARKALIEMLKGFGYREILAIEDGADVGRLMWVRDPWPIDVEVLRDRELETYTRF